MKSIVNGGGVDIKWNGPQYGGRIELLNGGLQRECSSASTNSTHK